ncbi:hypothetical protein JY651_50225 [Pyxidicoccus parkwayensis]|uniref:Lipoprotein n=1 Tax=Pyxidicoccus parkwayensis TaxID=2813578 RepID=A0ABX7NXI6_9BACT|nr:hypothetical protein [Pyxidicoccus parkwaysis]QSQ23173.1 hypothetical protein JY651_50225 [Pyxidicoccus parkwaysis]
MRLNDVLVCLAAACLSVSAAEAAPPSVSMLPPSGGGTAPPGLSPGGEEVLNAFEPCDPQNELWSPILPYVGQKVANYEPPGDGAVVKVREVFDSLEAEDLPRLQAALGALNMRGCRLGSAEDSMVFFWAPVSARKVAFIWRVGQMQIPSQPETHGNPVAPLILSSPHEGTDGVFRTATTVMATTRARILLMNVVHKGSSSETATCQNSPISDGAHSVSTLFHRAHVNLASMYPYAFFVQLHGMVGAPNFHLLLVNSFNSRFTTKYKSGPQLVGEALPEFFDTEQRGEFALCSDFDGGYNYQRPTGCHNTNVNAHQLNRGNQCAVGEEDTGRFLHAELDPSFRDNANWRNRSQLFGNALNRAMEQWLVAPKSYPVE